MTGDCYFESILSSSFKNTNQNFDVQILPASLDAHLVHLSSRGPIQGPRAKLLLSNEIKVLKMCKNKCKFIVNIIGAFKSATSDEVFLATEKVNGGDLYTALSNKNGPLTESTSLHVVECISKALTYLHSRNVRAI